MKKKICIILIFCISLFGTVSYSYNDSDVNSAKKLYDLGLLKGNTGTFNVSDMELDRYATRAEMAITVTRLLGNEQKALYQKNPTPFYDVPIWATDYIGWLYENYLINGVTDNYFASNDYATVQQFCAMMLRVLGFDDSLGDFNYNDAISFSQSKGLINAEISSHYYLLRSDMVNISLNALKTNIKDSHRLLAKKLCDEKAIGSNAISMLGIKQESVLEANFASVTSKLPNISYSKSVSNVDINFDNDVENYGIRVFYTSDSNSTVKEIPQGSGGGIYFEKGQIHYVGAAGYLNYLTVYGLGNQKNCNVIVIKTSSEGSAYDILAKSNCITIE